jgi:hypothetical protein
MSGVGEWLHAVHPATCSSQQVNRNVGSVGMSARMVLNGQLAGWHFVRTLGSKVE